MNRRTALQRTALLMGGTIIGGQLFLQAGCKPATKDVAGLFEADSIALLDEIAETIFPATNTPGAKAAKVGEFIPVMVRDCYTPDQQKAVLDGLADMDKRCKEKYSNSFMKMTPEQRTEFLNVLDKEQRAYQKDVVEKAWEEQRKKAKDAPPTAEKPKDPVPHYFRLLKETTVLGFFTSEAGATKVLRYKEVPGKYEGCIDYKKGDRAWAT